MGLDALAQRHSVSDPVQTTDTPFRSECVNHTAPQILRSQVDLRPLEIRLGGIDNHTKNRTDPRKPYLS